jgi:hypothetical protein
VTPGSRMRLRRGLLMRQRRGPLMRLGRASFIAILVAMAVVPGPASEARPCTNRACQSAGVVRWSRPLPGARVAQPGLAGTTPAQGDVYAALDGRIGTTVFAYQSRSGSPVWDSSLAGFRAGTRIVSVRVWPGVITVGVEVPGRRARTAATRHEVVLNGGTGRLIRSYPSAAFGGAIAADSARTVIVGGTAVTSYSNRTGAVLWSHPTGPAAQAWKVSGNDLYLTVSTGGYLSNGPVRALRKIFLRSGVQRLVRPPGRSFRGVLSRVFAGVVVFTDARGTIAYSAVTGRKLWRRVGRCPRTRIRTTGCSTSPTAAAWRGWTPRRGGRRPACPADRPLGRPASMLSGTAWCSASTKGPREMRGVTTWLSAGCSGPTPTCTGRTFSWTCPVSAAAPAPGQARSCWRSAARPGRRRAAGARSATGPNWSP